jgi:hypothetical protein
MAQRSGSSTGSWDPRIQFNLICMYFRGEMNMVDEVLYVSQKITAQMTLFLC